MEQQPQYVQQQPMAAPGMSMSYVPPKRDQFSTELFGCKGAGDFCFACCCMVFGKNQQRLNSLSNGVALRPEQVEACGGPTVMFLLVQYITGCGGTVMECLQREKIRQHYSIPGDTGTDCFMACCCVPCALLQEERELEIEENLINGTGKH